MSEPSRLSDRLAGLGARLGVDVSPADDDDGAAEVAAMRRAVLDDHWRAICPRRFVDATLADLGGAVAGELAGWIESPDRNVVLLGPVGAGKSHAAWALMSWLHRAPRSWAGASVPEVLDGLRPDREPGVRLDVDFLLLDDIGAERRTEWTAEQLARIIDSRWTDERPLVVTSNLAPAALADWVGERAWSRLAGGALVLGVTGVDRRFAR